MSCQIGCPTSGRSVTWLESQALTQLRPRSNTPVVHVSLTIHRNPGIDANNPRGRRLGVRDRSPAHTIYAHVEVGVLHKLSPFLIVICYRDTLVNNSSPGLRQNSIQGLLGNARYQWANQPA